jgi:hypothetical protein
MKEEPAYTRILLGAFRKTVYRWASLSAGALYFVFYLYAVGQLIFDPNVVSPRGTPAFVLDPGWAAKILDPIAGYTFEPVAALYLFEGLTILIAPLNLLIGAGLGGLVALNVASALYALAAVRSCRRLSWAALLGSLPALLTGFACCVPTVGLVLGANLALTLVGLQGILLPVSAVGLVAGLLWNLRRTRREFLHVSSEPL